MLGRVVTGQTIKKEPEKKYETGFFYGPSELDFEKSYIGFYENFGLA